MKCSLRIVASLLLYSTTTLLLAQMTVSGTITDGETGMPLDGANIVVEGTELGAAADANGAFTINGVPDGATISASMIGYEDASAEAAYTVNFALTSTTIEMSSLEVLASRADQKTPVAYTNVTKADVGVLKKPIVFEWPIPFAISISPFLWN